MYLRVALAVRDEFLLLTPDLADRLSVLLLSSRFVSGIGLGLCNQLFPAIFAHITPSPERPKQMTRFLLGNMIGIGLGPTVASGLKILDLCPEGFPRYEVVGAVQLVVAFGALISMVFFHPSLKGVQDFVTSQQMLGMATFPPEEVSRRGRLVCGCLVMTFSRAFVVSGLESATALLLEKDYHWQSRHIGIVIGITFLCSVPLKIVHEVLDKRLSSTQWIRLMSYAALLGSPLLFHSIGTWLSLSRDGCSMILLVADAVIFPTLYLSDGLSIGVMQQNLLPEGSLLDTNHTSLFRLIFTAFGRFLGPYAARWHVDNGDQNQYAMQQLVSSAMFLFVFEVMVRPLMREESFAKIPQDLCQWYSTVQGAPSSQKPARMVADPSIPEAA